MIHGWWGIVYWGRLRGLRDNFGCSRVSRTMNDRWRIFKASSSRFSHQSLTHLQREGFQPTQTICYSQNTINQPVSKQSHQQYPLESSLMCMHLKIIPRELANNCRWAHSNYAKRVQLKWPDCASNLKMFLISIRRQKASTSHPSKRNNWQWRQWQRWREEADAKRQQRHQSPYNTLIIGRHCTRHHSDSQTHSAASTAPSAPVKHPAATVDDTTATTAASQNSSRRVHNACMGYRIGSRKTTESTTECVMCVV